MKCRLTGLRLLKYSRIVSCRPTSQIDLPRNSADTRWTETTSTGTSRSSSPDNRRIDACDDLCTGTRYEGVGSSVEIAPRTSAPVESVYRENAARGHGEAENRHALRMHVEQGDDPVEVSGRHP